jgi:hypothetical protein
MKRAARIFFVGLIGLLSAGFLTRLWLTRPEIFPAFPKPLAEYLVKLYGAQNAEEVADLELLIGLCLSFAIVFAITLLGIFIWRWIKRQKKQEA